MQGFTNYVWQVWLSAYIQFYKNKNKLLQNEGLRYSMLVRKTHMTSWVAVMTDNNEYH